MYMDKEFLFVEDIAEILHIKPNTIHSKRWKVKSGCPINKIGKRDISIGSEFWKWFKQRG